MANLVGKMKTLKCFLLFRYNITDVVALRVTDVLRFAVEFPALLFKFCLMSEKQVIGDLEIRNSLCSVCADTGVGCV